MKNYKWVFLMFKTIHRFIIKKEKKKKFLVQYNCTSKIKPKHEGAFRLIVYLYKGCLKNLDGVQT